MAEETAFRYDVFISYSQQDAEWTLDWLLPRLKEAGLVVAIDEETFRAGVPVLAEVEALEVRRATPDQPTQTLIAMVSAHIKRSAPTR